MRRVGAALFAIGLLIVPFDDAGAAARQVVRGQVTVPLPGYVGPARTVGCGLADATAGWATGRNQGMFAYRITVDPATRGRPFTLRADAPSDLDIAFWTGERVEFATKGVDGEKGTVPAAARTATVCLDSGAPTAFTYTAG